MDSFGGSPRVRGSQSRGQLQSQDNITSYEMESSYEEEEDEGNDLNESIIESVSIQSGSYSKRNKAQGFHRKTTSSALEEVFRIEKDYSIRGELPQQTNKRRKK